MKTCRRCGDTTAAGCEDWDCHEGWGPPPPAMPAAEFERQRIVEGVCPRSGQRIMPGGSLRPACALCDCGEES